MTQQPHSGPGPPYYRGFTITLRHTTLGRTPLEGYIVEAICISKQSVKFADGQQPYLRNSWIPLQWDATSQSPQSEEQQDDLLG